MFGKNTVAKKVEVKKLGHKCCGKTLGQNTGAKMLGKKYCGKIFVWGKNTSKIMGQNYWSQKLWENF